MNMMPKKRYIAALFAASALAGLVTGLSETPEQRETVSDTEVSQVICRNTDHVLTKEIKDLNTRLDLVSDYPYGEAIDEFLKINHTHSLLRQSGDAVIDSGVCKLPDFNTASIAMLHKMMQRSKDLQQQINGTQPRKYSI